MRGRIEAVVKGMLRGWIWDPSQPNVRIAAEVVIDGMLVGTVVAQRRRADLVKAGIGDGAHAFDLTLPPALCDGRQHLIVLRGFREAITIVADTRKLVIEQLNPTLVGKVEGVRRSNLIGWAWDRAQPEDRILIEIRVDDKQVMKIPADRARADLLKSGIGDGKHAFEVPLAALTSANGKAAELTVVAKNATGEVTLGKLAISEAASKPEKAASAKVLATDAGATAPVKALPLAAQPAAKVIEPLPLPMPNLKELLKEASAAEAAGDLAKACQILDCILAGKPKEIEALFRRARVALAMSDIAAAKDFAGRVIEIKKNHSKALVSLARAAELEKQWRSDRKSTR